MSRQIGMAKNQFAIFLISALLFGCGGSTTGFIGGGVGGDGSPTLGITSIQKGGVGKPSLVMNWLNRGLGFMFGEPVMAQASCAPATPAHTIDLMDGTIWITQAYIIMDEIEFDFQSVDLVSPEIGPFAIDATDSDTTVPQTVDLTTIPPGDYEFASFKVARLDTDPPEALPKNLVGTSLDDFIAKLFDDTVTPRRPSIWIEGFTQVTSFNSCSFFKFFTDKSGLQKIDFIPGTTVDPSQLDVVFFLDIKQAFNNLDGSTFVQDFENEIGSIFGPDFIDGRDLKELGLGTPKAVALARELFKEFEVFTQPPGSFDGTMAADATPVS